MSPASRWLIILGSFKGFIISCNRQWAGSFWFKRIFCFLLDFKSFLTNFYFVLGTTIHGASKSRGRLIECRYRLQNIKDKSLLRISFLAKSDKFSIRIRNDFNSYEEILFSVMFRNKRNWSNFRTRIILRNAKLIRKYRSS